MKTITVNIKLSLLEKHLEDSKIKEFINVFKSGAFQREAEGDLRKNGTPVKIIATVNID